MRYAIPALLLVPALLAAQTPDAATLAGIRWRSIGPVNMAGRITDVEVDPRNQKVFYIAAATGGIWKTVNAGTTGASTVDTGDYRVVLDLGGAKQSAVLRVVRVAPGEVSVMQGVSGR